MKKNVLIVLFLIILGFILRILYLNNSLWYDEACSWTTASQSFPLGVMKNLIQLDLQHTPLYFFILHFWMKIFGQGETALRLLSLIFGLGTIPVVYFVANKITTRINAFFAAAICAVSPLLVLFSAEVRMYPIVIFLVMMSLNYLVDFEQKSDKKSLIKLLVTNILIPYSFVGGILYNFSLLICYGRYLLKKNEEKFKSYKIFAKLEWICLIPYFLLMFYYAKMRSIFVISHEGVLKFSHIVDVVRNFFGGTIENNVYWVSGNYEINFIFTLFVIIPCVYFILGFIKSVKSDDKFIKILSYIFLLNFFMALILAALQINVFTVRYILYILPPVIILAVKGLGEKYNNRYLSIFLSIFIIFAGGFSIINSRYIKENKELAFKSPALECDKYELSSDDVVIMPFGSDAPYYFRYLTVPRVYNFDFHKIARNPYGVYYDKNQQKAMTSKEKYKLIFEKINENNVFSQSFYDYFHSVAESVPQGHFAILAMYGEDNSAIISVQTLRKQVKDVKYVKNHTLDVLFKKYMCDIIAMLNLNFKFIQMYKKDNFTYYIYQKI